MNHTTTNDNQSNPELAQAYTATIFSTLYESWPVRVSINAQQINLHRWHLVTQKCPIAV
ncbi:hypothetical protein [Vibrio neptunius]|uniref:hypothetical protein n=1 Tax=Vibrio neptunius TaxID=170651 RepID=UPI003CE50F2F